jgi:hypothetical protein
VLQSNGSLSESWQSRFEDVGRGSVLHALFMRILLMVRLLMCELIFVCVEDA